MTDRNLLPVQPVSHPVDADVTLPGSKSYTNRALVIAALAAGRSSICHALQSDDTHYMTDSLRALGIHVESSIDDENDARLEIEGSGGNIPAWEARLFVGNAGTAMRFLTSVAALAHGHFEIDGSPRMRERPIGVLLDGLNQLGVDARSALNNGCPPVIVNADGMEGGVARMKGSVSSQYFTSILLIAPYADKDVKIIVEGEMVSRPYIRMTESLMSQFGVAAENYSFESFYVRSGQRYHALDYTVEPDASSASYFFAAAAITQGRVRVRDLPPLSAQGDLRFVDLLEAMGCTVHRFPDSVEVIGASELDGLDIDMSDMPDMVATLAAIAPFAKSKTTIRNVGFIRHHETDRIHAVSTELRRLGAKVDELDDGLIIYPSELHGADIETYEDHRIAMSFAVVGLRVPGIRIINSACVAKTFPDFFEKFNEVSG